MCGRSASSFQLWIAAYPGQSSDVEAKLCNTLTPQPPCLDEDVKVAVVQWFKQQLCEFFAEGIQLPMRASTSMETTFNGSYFFPLESGVDQAQEWMPAFKLPYLAFPRWYEFGERRWNDILTGENRRARRKTCPSATLPTTNPTWIGPGTNPGLRGERPATNDLSHGTALTILTPSLRKILERFSLNNLITCSAEHN
jgi:hypothetical protein